MALSEAQVKAWLSEHHNVPRETLLALDCYVAMLAAEATRQNLVSRSTLSSVWERHILDSAQLLGLATGLSRSWLDVGSGAGLPGIVIGLLSEVPVTLVESRRLRIAFLESVVAELGLASRITIAGMPLERLDTRRFDVITARAFAPLDTIFMLAMRFSDGSSQWILPKGRSVNEELAAAKRTWQGEFAVAPSITDDGAGIVLARNVKPRKAR